MKSNFNYTSLAREAGVSYNTFKKEFDNVLSDPEIKAKYGKVCKNRISEHQIQILANNIVGLEHLKK